MAEPLTAIFSCLGAPALSPVLALTLASPFANPAEHCSLFIGFILCWVSHSRGLGSARASTREGAGGLSPELSERIRRMTPFCRRGVHLYHLALLEVDFAVQLTVYQLILQVTLFLQLISDFSKLMRKEKIQHMQKLRTVSCFQCVTIRKSSYILKSFVKVQLNVRYH